MTCLRYSAVDQEKKISEYEIQITSEYEIQIISEYKVHIIFLKMLTVMARTRVTRCTNNSGIHLVQTKKNPDRNTPKQNKGKGTNRTKAHTKKTTPQTNTVYKQNKTTMDFKKRDQK